jgi:hypothetical protein
MKHNAHHTSSIYQYLELTGVLATGSHADIQAARKQYWNKIKAAYKRKQRKEQKQYTISFTKQENAIIAKAATSHCRSNTAYCKAAALAYTKKQFIFPDITLLNDIKQSLLLLYYRINEIKEAGTISIQREQQLQQDIQTLQEALLLKLETPREKEVL